MSVLLHWWNYVKCTFLSALPSDNAQRRKKWTRIPWTKRELDQVSSFFASFIRTHKIPRNEDVKSFKERFPEFERPLDSIKSRVQYFIKKLWWCHLYSCQKSFCSMWLIFSYIPAKESFITICMYFLRVKFKFELPFCQKRIYQVFICTDCRILTSLWSCI